MTISMESNINWVTANESWTRPGRRTQRLLRRLTTCSTKSKSEKQKPRQSGYVLFSSRLRKSKHSSLKNLYHLLL